MTDNGELSNESDKLESKAETGFNRVWTKLPHISLYQLIVSATAGWSCIINGLWSMYPNFAQFKTPARCHSVFDNGTGLELRFEYIASLIVLSVRL